MNFKVKKTIFPNRDSKKFKWFEWSFSAFIKAIIGRLEQEKDVFILVTGQTGCQPAGSKVLMSNGEWKNVEEVKIGDEIISPQKDGTNKFSKVTFIADWYSKENYSIIEKNSKKILYNCSYNHLIPLSKNNKIFKNFIAKNLFKDKSINKFCCQKMNKKFEKIEICCEISKSISERVYGFEVDSDSHWYITDNWMITHNSGKSHLSGNFNLKYLSKIDNFIKNDGSKIFEKKNFIITPDEFAVKMITERGSSLWLDEGRDAVNRQKWYAEVNQLIASRKNKNRKNFNIYWLCMPYESEVDPKMAKHLHIWIWVRRGVGEVYCRQSGKKGGTGLDIQKILDREEKWFRENPKSNKIIPTIHPEFVGRIFFNKLTAGYEREYNKLVEDKKAVGELSEEEKEEYGIIEKRSPESMVAEQVGLIKEGTIDNKKDLWVKLKEETNLPDTDLKNMINFYLNLENLPSFSRLFAQKVKINKTGEVF